MKMKEKENREREAKEKLENLSQQSSANISDYQGVPAVGTGEQNYWISTFSSVLWNIAPFVLFASFMYIVQLVLSSS